MTANDMKKRRLRLMLGAAGCALLMLSDLMWKAKGAYPASTLLGSFADKAWLDMDMWRFILSNILAALAMPLYFIGFMEMYKLIKERAVSKLEKRLAWWFRFGAVAGVISILFIHTLCVNLPMIFKTIQPYMDVAKAAELTNNIMMLNVVPWLTYFTATDVVLSAVIIALAWKKTLPLGRIAMLCNPIVTAGIGAVLAMLPWPLSLIDTVSEPCGHLLIMVLGLIAVSKDLKRTPQRRRRQNEDDLPPVWNLDDEPDSDLTVI